MLAHELTIFGVARYRPPYFLLVVLSCLWALPASAAPKTDTVYFKNGDILTGEIKSLKRGRLSLNTDATGTINIEWDKVAGLNSDQHIQVETTSGIRYFGNLASSESKPGLIIVTGNGPQTLDPTRVVVMSPIEGGGIHALDVDISVGYNFTKAGGIETGNLGLNMDYRSLIRIESLKFSQTLSDSDTQEASNRMNLGLQHTRLWANRWFSTGSLTFDKNDELDLNLRTSLGGGVGRYLVQNNTMIWSIDAGLQVAREDVTTSDEDTDSVEALFTVQWDWFLFQNPELDWATTLQAIPSLTENGRVRGEIDTTLQWEIIGDLNWGFSFYGTFDNQSQSDASSDYGFNTSVIYEF